MEVVNIPSMKMMKELAQHRPTGRTFDYPVIPGRCAASNPE
jgi:hypothetical protein